MFDVRNASVGDYLRALMLLLPRGYAWKWLNDSVGRRYLTVIASELHRLHIFLELITEYSINRFVTNRQGWSAIDYEELLLRRFGIDANVSDGIQPFSCESACTNHLLDERIHYVYVITVDDVSTVPNAVYAFLKQYQQSHTHFHFRDLQTKTEQVKVIDSLHVGFEYILKDIQGVTSAGDAEASDNLIEYPFDSNRVRVIGGMHCESPLYEEPFFEEQQRIDWSFSYTEKPHNKDDS